MSSVEQRMRDTGLFGALTQDELISLCDEVETLTYGPGEVVFYEGEVDSALYVVDQGTAQIFTQSQDGSEMVLAKVGASAYFGEHALLERSDRHNASVRAFTSLRLLCIDRDRFQHFQRVLSRDSPLRWRLQDVGENQLRENLVRQSALFRTFHLDEDDEFSHVERFAAGEVVFREGEPASRFYLVLAGVAAVFQDDAGSRKLVVNRREGQCFGELALIHRSDRTETVIAAEPLEVLSVAGDRFLEVYESSPALRQYMQTLEKIYQLPGLGFATQHGAQFLGEDAITTIYHLADGRLIFASHVIGREIYNMRVADEREKDETRTISYEDEATGSNRQLVLLNEEIRGVTVWGSWEELGDLHRMVFDQLPLTAWQEQLFRQTGSLRLEDEPTLFEDSETVCSCVQVSRGTLRRAIAGGCNTVKALGDETGAGSVCGACIPRLEEMLGRGEWILVSCAEVIEVTDDVRSFRLAPRSGELKAPRCGQHVVVEANIDGRWVLRPYTLSSAATRTDFYEITVKREPRGLFSSWLFDRYRDDVLIRVSAPQGEFTLDRTGESAPIVFWVAGIGVTPALAMVRTFLADGTDRRLHIDYSCTRPENFAYLEELREAAERNPNITLRVRRTSREGMLDDHPGVAKSRVGQRDVAGVLAELPDAVFMVCGPAGYQDRVTKLLALLDVPDERVLTEEFTPQGNRPPEAGTTAARPEVSGRIAAPPPKGPPGPAHDDPTPVPEILAAQPGTMEEEAKAFLQRFYYEKEVPQAFEPRWAEVRDEIERTGTYVQTFDELSFGAKLAWRNSAKCIGRLFWPGLQVRDMRHVTSEDEVFEALCDHIRLATNDGNLRAVMTVFRQEGPDGPGPRIWNSLLIRYAGYRQDDGSWIGDPGNEALTKAALDLGWAPEKRTHYDVLPLIVQFPPREPKFFEIPSELVLEVPLTHPELPWFEELGLRWCALPAVADMLFDCGGIHYTMAPFSGWYMGTEIGARNMGDDYRYNQLPVVAERMGLDCRRERTLWRDKALVEMNVAVLHAFERAGVKVVDHHAASADFMEFAEQEAAAGRRIDARWDWVVPPMSGSTCPVFHVGWKETVIKPNYFPQPRPYA